MISLIVDEAYAFDYLSILEVKKEKLPNSKNLDAFDICAKHIRNQTGEQLFYEIINSPEYNLLFKANEETFEAVEKARYGSISAKKVDDLNMNRYNKKIALQKKFFPNSILKETKT